MTSHTYVINHEAKLPKIREAQKLAGGKVLAIRLGDALERLDAAEELLTEISDTAQCKDTQNKIRQFFDLEARHAPPLTGGIKTISGGL